MSVRDPSCVVVTPSGQFRGKQNLDYVRGISAETVGARGLCMHLLTIPPGGRAAPHSHEGHETGIYVLSGEAGMWYGEGLREHLTIRAGQLLYIPAGVPHLPYNLSDTEPCTAVLARTDPNEQESVVPYDALDPGRAAGPIRTGRQSSLEVEHEGAPDRRERQSPP